MESLNLQKLMWNIIYGNNKILENSFSLKEKLRNYAEDTVLLKKKFK